MKRLKGSDLASRLKQRVTLQTPNRISDGSGGYTETWSNFATVFAEVLPLNGREILDSLRVQSVITHRVTIRYIAGITPKMRLAYAGRNFNIRAVVNEDEKGESLKLYCEEGVGT